jgi:lysophospholipase L1-like esterase
MLQTLLRLLFLIAFVSAGQANAEQPWIFSDKTRYMALGDSLAAGYGATPTTQGYAYQLYQKGVYAKAVSTIFANAAVPGTTSTDMLKYQVPQAADIFKPDVITISIGGNDLLQVLVGADPQAVLGQFHSNLVSILCTLRAALPQARIYIGNQYDIPEITSQVPGGPELIAGFNAIVAGVASACRASVADVFSHFEGRSGLLLIERNRADESEVHPSNAGHRAMAAAFEAAHR